MVKPPVNREPDRDPSIDFLNRVMDRISTDSQFRSDLANCAERGDSDGIWSLLEDPDLVPDGYWELSDAWLESLVGGRGGGLPLAMVLLAGSMGSGFAQRAGAPIDAAIRASMAQFSLPAAMGSRGGVSRSWIDHALPLIRHFEGLALEAYRDPVGIPTIGYGTTHYPDGRAVRLGDQISQNEAETLLRRSLETHVAPAVLEIVPLASRLEPPQQAALVSFAYNVGLGALQQSTLRRRLLAGENPDRVIAEELPRWCRGNGDVLPGLVRRRAAEVALFTGGGGPVLGS